MFQTFRVVGMRVMRLVRNFRMLSASEQVTHVVSAVSVSHMAHSHYTGQGGLVPMAEEMQKTVKKISEHQEAIGSSLAALDQSLKELQELAQERKTG